MLLNEFDLVNEKIMDPREAIIRRALEIIDQDMKNDPRKVKALERYAFDVWRAVGLKNMTPRDLVALYRDWKGVTEGVGRITAQNKTADVGYDAITKEAAKFGNKVDRDGRPPLLRVDEAISDLGTDKNDKFGIKFENLRRSGKKVGTVNGMHVLFTQNLGFSSWQSDPGFMVWDPKERAVAGVLTIKDNWEAATLHPKTVPISVAAVNSKYEGQGLIFKMYVLLVKRGFALLSDDLQSRGGRGLWTKLAATPGINVYAVDTAEDPPAFSAVDPEDITDGSFMVYDSDEAELRAANMQLADLERKQAEVNDQRLVAKRAGDTAQMAKAEDQMAAMEPELKALRLEIDSWTKHVRTGRGSKLMAVAEKMATTESRITEGEYPIEHWDNWEGDRQYREQGAKIVPMTPEDYLSRVRPLTMDPESEENIDLLISHVKAGGRLDPLKIYANGKEDGRHRAYAAKALGIKRVPVIVWPQLDESYTPLQMAIMEGGHLLESDETREELEEWLASLESEMEEVDDASRWAAEDGEDTSSYDRDYQALHAVEMVVRNHLTALRNPVLLDQSIFLYNIVTDALQYAGLHIVIDGDVAELKWLGNLGRKGVGSKLLHQGLEMAKARGAKRVKLTTKWNSEGFYQKAGFKADSATTSNAFSNSNNTEMSKTLESRLNEIGSVELDKNWGEVSRWRWSGKNSDRVFKIGRVAGLDVVIERGSTRRIMTVYLVDRAKDNLTVGEIQLDKEYNAWITDTSILSQEYQGRGIMLQVYVLLCKKGLILRSGSQQSAGGKKIWLNLSKQPGITVYAGYEKPDGEWVYSDIDNEDDDRLRGGLAVYDKDNYEVDNEYQAEIFSLERNIDKMSARALKATTPEEKAKWKAAYDDLTAMLKKAEEARIAANKASRQQHTDWEDTFLFAVADGVEPSNRF